MWLLTRLPRCGEFPGHDTPLPVLLSCTVSNFIDTADPVYVDVTEGTLVTMVNHTPQGLPAEVTVGGCLEGGELEGMSSPW